MNQCTEKMLDRWINNENNHYLQPQNQRTESQIKSWVKCTISKAKCLHKWTLELILMHLLLEMNRWHFKNSLCLQFTVKIKPHHHFQRWQWDSSAWVFLGWQTPALIQAWMMSPIHYTMIKSLPPTPRPSVASLLWTRHSSRHRLCFFFFGETVSTGRLRTGRNIPATQPSSPRKWGMMGKDPVTRQAPCCWSWREAKTRQKNRKPPLTKWVQVSCRL